MKAILLAVAMVIALAGGQLALGSHSGGTVLVDAADGTADTAGCGDPANPCNTIQAGVDHASAGETVRVAAGTYNEGAVVAKALTLRGPNAGSSGTGPRVAEAVVSTADTSFLVSATGVTIDGFEIAGDFGVYVTAPGAVTVANSRITGTTRAISVEGSGDGASILNNDLVSSVRSLHVSGPGPYTDLAVNGNRFSGAAVTGIFFLGNVAVTGFEFKGNEVLHLANIASTITNGEVSGNTFAVASGTYYNIAIDLHDSVVTGNTFDGSGVRSCLNLRGILYGLPASTNVTISDNTLSRCNTYAINLGRDVDGITITGNTITDAFHAFTTIGDDAAPGESGNGPFDATGKTFLIERNRITGTIDSAFSPGSGMIGTIDLANNWWGTAAGPGDLPHANVVPWCVNEACTAPTPTPAPIPTPTPTPEPEEERPPGPTPTPVLTLPPLPSPGTGQVPAPQVETRLPVRLPPTGVMPVTVVLKGTDETALTVPYGTEVRKTDGEVFTGVIEPPRRVVDPTQGKLASAYRVGADEPLTFDRPVTLTIPAPPGMDAARFQPVFIDSGGRLTYLVGRAVDDAVSFETEHLSVFGLAEVPKPGVYTVTRTFTKQDGYHAAWAGQSAFPTLVPGQLVDLAVVLRNTGHLGWYVGVPGEHFVVLGSADPLDNTRAADLGILVADLYGRNRFAALAERYVGPGDVGTFWMRLRAPQAVGTFVIRLRPVIDGLTWLEDEGIYLEMKVEPGLP